MFPIVCAVTVAFGSVFVPHVLDLDGRGLRIYHLGARGPLIAGEPLNRIPFAIALHNYSKKTLAFRPLDDAIVTGDLRLTISGPAGKPLQSMADAYSRSNAPVAKLLAGERTSRAFRFADFGYGEIREPGQYRLQASLKLDAVVLAAPPVFFEVVDPLAESILSSFRIPLEGPQAALPPFERPNPVLQQVKIRDRVLLVYRRFCGAKWNDQIDSTTRLAELPGKVLDLKVEGAYGSGNPLTITYREHSYSKFTTTLVINSIDGRPWTAEEEKHRQEKLKKLALVPEKK